MAYDNFTRQEREQIKYAFEKVSYELERAPWDYKSRWQDAFKQEKRECTDTHWARLLMVKNFAQGVRSPKCAAELFGIRPGCMVAHIIGAALIDRAERYGGNDASIAAQRIRDDLMHVCDIATAAMEAALERGNAKP